MAFELTHPGGGRPHEPWCTSCHAPITRDQRSVQIKFETDPHGHNGLSGLYHEACSKPFASLARAINMMSFRRF